MSRVECLNQAFTVWLRILRNGVLVQGPDMTVDTAGKNGSCSHLNLSLTTDISRDMWSLFI